MRQPAVVVAQHGDIAECAVLYERIGRTHFTWKPDGAFRAGDFAAIAAQEDVWVVRRGGALAGFMTYFVPDHFVHLLFIDDVHRRLGFARTMLDHARMHYGQPHSLKVDEANEVARVFYERLGYVPVARGDGNGLYWLRLASP